ncbi:MAG: hypothetical protein ACKVZJ_04160 [Phycisphaerales bacterium]
MSRLERVHLVVLGVWLGGLVAVGGVAASAFPMMKSLQPVLPGFRVEVMEHWSIAAGHVMNPAFFVLLISGLALGALALVAWGSMGWWRRLVGLALVVLAVGTLLGVAVPMRGHLEVYWAAARAGEIEAAVAAKAAFDLLHPWSSRLLGAQAVLVFSAIVMGVMARGATARGARNGAKGGTGVEAGDQR